MPSLGLTCLFHPLACASSQLDAVPWFWLVLAGALVGLLLGAWLGRWGVALLLTAGVAYLVLRPRLGDDTAAENVDGPDAQPSHPKPKKPRPEPPDPFGQNLRKKH